MEGKVNHNFQSLDGGLFSSVTKADVGDGIGKLIQDGYTIMSWADPFFPDPVLPESVQLEMIKCIQNGDATHYSMPIGLAEMRQAVAERIQKTYGVEINPARNVLITPGSDSALLYAMMAMINPGDEVLIFDPSYPSNYLNVEMCGGIPISVPLYEEEGYTFHAEDIRSRITKKTKMVVLTHPNNPTATVLRKEKIIELCDLIIQYDLVLVCDQAFEDHIYDEIEFACPAFQKGMWDRTITVFSISKGLALSGYRVGYIVSNEKIMNVLYGGAVNFLGATNTLSQKSAIVAFQDNSVLKRYRAIFQKRRDMAYDIFRRIPGVSATKPESGILIWLNTGRLGSDSEVAAYLLKHARVSVNEGKFYGPLGGPGHIRIVFSCYADDEKAFEAYKRIATALEALAKEKNII